MVKSKNNPTVFGAFEYVSFPEWSEVKILAKIDTGAYSGALHCTYIDYYIDKKNLPTLEFSPFGHQELVFRTHEFKLISVKSSNGQVQSRYSVRTQLIVKNKVYNVDITLTDCGAMQYEVLVGRRFLRANNILVDVSQYKKEHERFGE